MYFVTTAPRSSASMPRKDGAGLWQSVNSAEFRFRMVSFRPEGGTRRRHAKLYKAAWFETVAAPCRTLATGAVRRTMTRPQGSSSTFTIFHQPQVPLCAICRHSNFDLMATCFLTADARAWFAWWGIYLSTDGKDHRVSSSAHHASFCEQPYCYAPRAENYWTRDGRKDLAMQDTVIFHRG